MEAMPKYTWSTLLPIPRAGNFFASYVFLGANLLEGIVEQLQAGCDKELCKTANNKMVQYNDIG